MSELTKNQLKTDNTNSFPNNTTGYITPTILRDFNTNMIDSLVDEVSYNIESASFNSRIEAGGAPAGTVSSSAQIAAFGYATTSSVSAITASSLVNASATQNVITFTKGDGSTFPVTVATGSGGGVSGDYVTTSSFNAYTQSNDDKVNALIAQTSSYAISSSVASTINALSASDALFYATKTELSASASTLQNGINSKVETSTFNSYTQSQAGVNAGLTAAIGTRLLTSSFNTYTSSNDGKVNQLISVTSSYATTGSNNFVGAESISGSLALTGSAPTHTFLSGGVNYSGSILTNATDTFPSVPQGNFVVTLSSASMATLLSGASTNANTIYFVV